MINYRGRMLYGVLTGVALLLAACGGDDPTPTVPPPTATATPTPTAVPTVAPTETPTEAPTPVQAESPLDVPQPDSPLDAPAQPESPLETPAAEEAMALVDTPPNADGYVELSVDELVELLAAKNFTLVNVHTPYEGELPETDLMIPADELADNLAELPDQAAPIVLYDRTGEASAQAAATLIEAGYTQVYVLEGGFDAWEEAGNELIQEAQ
jgi:rhodanese-related sulfurtransferase